MGLLNVILLIAICSLALSWSPKPVFHSRKSCLLSMATSNNQFSELEKKLAAKVSSQEAVMEASKVGVKGSGSKVTTSKAVKAPVVNKQSSAMSATKTENLASKKAVISSPAKPVSFRPAAVTSSPVKAAPVKPQALKVVSTQPSLSGGEYAAGIGLGLAPFLLIPVVLFNAAKKLVVAPKPLPETPVVQPKVATYTKPIGDGAKEGFSELLSNKQDEELQLTRKGVKLVIGSLAVAGGLTAALFATSLNEKPGNEVKPNPAVKSATLIKKSDTKSDSKADVKQKPSTAAAPSKSAEVVKPAAPKVEAKPAPKAELKSSDKAVEVKTEAKAIETNKAAVKTEEAKPAVKSEEVKPVVVKPVEKPPVEVKEPEAKVEVKPEVKVEAKPVDVAPVVEKAVEVKPKAEVKKVAEAEKVADAASSTTAATEQVYKPVTPKGMEPEKVDLEKLKALRKIRK